jgi:Ca-activated chloride channel homolog
MAAATGGTYVRSVAGDLDLDVIYREEIRGTMAHATLEGGRKRVWAERYQWPLLAAILLLLAARALPSRKYALLPLLAAAVLLHAVPGAAGPLQEGYKAYHQGRYEQALEHFIQGQLNNPDSPEVLYNIGNAYYRIGDYPAAQTHYTQALKKAPADLKSGLHYNLGNTAYRMGDLHEAVRYYETALQLAPDDIQAQENLEFVKKRLREQQAQQNSDTPQEGEGGNDRSDAGGPPQSGTEHPPAAPQGQPAHRAPEGEQQSSPSGESGIDSGANADPTAADREPSEGESPGEERPALPDPAVHMLNRLKDEPGRATMPSYGRQPVDRDW